MRIAQDEERADVVSGQKLKRFTDSLVGVD